MYFQSDIIVLKMVDGFRCGICEMTNKKSKYDLICGYYLTKRTIIIIWSQAFSVNDYGCYYILFINSSIKGSSVQ